MFNFNALSIFEVFKPSTENGPFSKTAPQLSPKAPTVAHPSWQTANAEECLEFITIIIIIIIIIPIEDPSNVMTKFPRKMEVLMGKP